MDFDRPITTVDIVLLTLLEQRLAVALYRRDRPPFDGEEALPGGFVHVDEDADLGAAAIRVLRIKAGLDFTYLEQLSTFSGRERDPRGWSISAAYLGVVPADRILRSGGRDVRLVDIDRLPAQLPFDHRRIIDAGVARLRNKSVYSTLPAFLLPEEFTIAELRQVYQAVLGVARLDLAGFRKKILDLRVIEPVEGKTRGGVHRPAQLYRLADPSIALFDRRI
jgi:8-oxo-dGTP diphosphatase